MEFSVWHCLANGIKTILIIYILKINVFWNYFYTLYEQAEIGDFCLQTHGRKIIKMYTNKIDSGYLWQEL